MTTDKHSHNHSHSQGGINQADDKTTRASSAPARKRRHPRQLAAMIVGAVCLVILLSALIFWLSSRNYPDKTIGDGRSDTKDFVVPKGASFGTISDSLRENGFIVHPWLFKAFVHWQGKASSIRHGTYHLPPKLTPKQLLDTLVKGAPQIEIRVTIPEGKNILDIAAILEGEGICTKEGFLKAALSPTPTRKHGLESKTAEGYLFPDTYQFPARSDPADIIDIMVRRHLKGFISVRKNYPKRMHWFRRTLGWGHHEILTLASIVEKETGQAEERPRIAGVFLNRLMFRSFRSKLLQTDPTIIYGCTVPKMKSDACKQFEGRIRRMHLVDKNNIYNTYTHKGLPPGPISNPGEEAIRAIFEPERSRYLFFVSKNDGTHYFSTSGAEHERAVDRFQRGL